MIDMHSKYDNMHKNEMFYALIYINNHIIVCQNYVLSRVNCRMQRAVSLGGRDEQRMVVCPRNLSLSVLTA